jgi:hypothetical protein
MQVAVGRLQRTGCIVELRGGTYHQRLRLSGVAHLTIRPYRHEQPVLDGSGLTPPRDLSALIEISAARDIAVRGLELTGYRTRRPNAVPVGIYVRGHDRAIRIIGNHVHDPGNYHRTRGSYAINAHGIAGYGDDPHTPVSGLRIIGNEVDHLYLGASESVVVNGNVVGWRIVRNTVRGNRVRSNDIGVEVAAENRHGRADHVLVARNHIARSLLTGIATGGYCDSHPGCGGVRTGWSRHNVFRQNWLRGNNQLDDGSPEVLIQYCTVHDRFVYNAITATDRDHVIYASMPRAGHGRRQHQ